MEATEIALLMLSASMAVLILLLLAFGVVELITAIRKLRGKK